MFRSKLRREKPRTASPRKGRKPKPVRQKSPPGLGHTGPRWCLSARTSIPLSGICALPDPRSSSTSARGSGGTVARNCTWPPCWTFSAAPTPAPPPLCLGLTQDKVRTKDLLIAHRLPTPKYILVKAGETFPRTRDLAYPLIVKPRFEDASLGITSESIVETEKGLQERVQYVHDTYRQGALVEEFIEGREINAALIGSAPVEALPLSEIRFHSGLARSIVSYEGKWLEESNEFAGTQPVCPAPLKAKEEFLVRDVALRAFKILECRDYARVDMRLREGVPYILEVNANPDISPGAGLARAARAAGISYQRLIERILAMAVKRKELLHAKS